MAGINTRLSLLLRVDSALCAIPLASVAEILRPLPLEPLPDMPTVVAGLAVVRGEPIAIVSAGPVAAATRYVILRIGTRRVGLMVDAVIDIRDLDPGLLGALPSLLSRNGTAIETIATLDGELLLVLNSGKSATALTRLVSWLLAPMQCSGD